MLRSFGADGCSEGMAVFGCDAGGKGIVAGVGCDDDPNSLRNLSNTCQASS